MSELERESKRLLELSRQARTPSASDRARIRGRLSAALGSAAISAPLANGTAHQAAAQAAGQAGNQAAGQAGNQAAGTQAASTAGAGTQAATAGGAAQSGAAAGSGLSAGMLGGAAGWGLAGALGAVVGGYLTLTLLGLSPVGTGDGLQEAAPGATSARPRSPSPSSTPAAPEQPLARDLEPVPPAPPTPAATVQPGPPQETKRAPTKRAKVAGTDSLLSEVQLLHEARAAWQRGDSAAGLGLLQRHRTRYPRSEVKAERETLRVLCLCDLGRTRQAERVARRLRRVAQASPLRAALERSCVAK